MRAETCWAGKVTCHSENSSQRAGLRRSITSRVTSLRARTRTDYAVNRQYSQRVGRFGSADPYQASSYLVNPQSWNRYSYVENDPIHNVDPLGLLTANPSPGGPDPCCLSCTGDGSTSPPQAPGPSCSIGVNFTSPLSPANMLSFLNIFLPARVDTTGPTDDSPLGQGWYYRVQDLRESSR